MCYTTQTFAAARPILPVQNALLPLNAGSVGGHSRTGAAPQDASTPCSTSRLMVISWRPSIQPNALVLRRLHRTLQTRLQVRRTHPSRRAYQPRTPQRRYRRQRRSRVCRRQRRPRWLRPGPVRGASVIGTNCRANCTAHTAPLCCAERETLRNAVCCANHVNPDGRANRRSVSGPDRRMRLERVSDP